LSQAQYLYHSVVLQFDLSTKNNFFLVF